MQKQALLGNVSTQVFTALCLVCGSTSAAQHTRMFFALARVHVLLVTSPRAGPAGPVACAPFRSDAEYDYFRRTKQLELTLTKPLGAVLEEAAAGAVVVAALQDGGGAAGKLRKGDRLLCIGGIQMSSAGFDAVMDALADAPDQVDLRVSRSVVTRAPRAPPAALPVLSIDKGDTVVSGEVERGSNLRSVVQAAGVDL